MIRIDFECTGGHRFEGMFGDYAAYRAQHDGGMIDCPLCGTPVVKRIFTGCSIHARGSLTSRVEKESPNLIDVIREFNRFVRENFEHVGRDFPAEARAIHYGIREGRGIYGESTLDEIRELRDEGIDIVPLIDADTIGH